MKKILFIFAILLIYAISSQAQWQTDVRLTDDIRYSSTSYNNARCIVSSGDIVHVTWFDNRDLNEEIYYKRSIDGGATWSADTRLTINSSASRYPSIAVSGQNVHLVWYEARDGNWEIYYKQSTNSGSDWGPDIRLTDNSFFSGEPSIAVSGQVVSIVWQDNRDGNDEIYYKRSADGGTTWSADTRLTNNPAESGSTSISVSGSLVCVVWNDGRDGNWEIYCKRSADGGLNWSPDIRLTDNAATSGYPSVSVLGTLVYVVWHDSRDGNFEIYFERSMDGGVNWEADARLTDNASVSGYPSVLISGTAVHIVWEDNLNGNYEIFYKYSTNNGITWSVDAFLTNDAGISDRANLSISGSVIHVLWEDNRDGNYEIYYKQDPTGNPIGIKNISSEIPEEFSLKQNFPNPFNPSTKIRFTLPKNSLAKIVIYDALGRELETIVNEQLNAGTYETTFNANRYTSGVYYYKLFSGDFVETKKMIMVK